VTSETGEVLELPLSRASGSWLDPRTGRYWRGDLEPPPGRDEYFGAELWLQTTCCGGQLLWARNAVHLEYLVGFIAGELREDRVGYAPLSYKLPTWMKEAKHRDEVLRKLARMRHTLD
jgi:hypothetical protein